MSAWRGIVERARMARRVKLTPKPHGSRNEYGNKTSGNHKRRRRALPARAGYR